MVRRRGGALVAGTSVVVLAWLLSSIAGAEPGFAPAAQIPSPIAATRTAGGAYSSVSCATSASCTAVGPATFAPEASIATKPTALTEHSGAWTRTALPLPAATTTASLAGVVCGSAGDCTAVGGAMARRASEALVETEVAGTWSASVVTAPDGDASYFDGLWCASKGNCVATGTFASGSSSDLGAMVDVEDAGVWGTSTALPAPAIPGVTAVVPYAIACHDVDDCTVLGIGTNFVDGSAAVAWTETSATWGAAVALPKADGQTFVGTSLACPTSTACLAVGALEHRAGTVLRPASDAERSGTWAEPTAVPMPKLSPVATTGSFTSLGCGPTVCEAVGVFRPTSRSTTTIAGAATWSDVAWSSIGLVPTVRVTGGSPADLAGDPAFGAVSCATDAACVGVGTFGLGEQGPTGDFAARIATTRSVAVPGAPGLIGGEPGVRSARLFWSPPLNDGGSPVTTFTATVEPGGRTCATGAYHCTVGGLVDGHQYVVVVSATNAAGDGAAGQGRFIAGGPPTEPRDLHVAGWAKGVVTLAWHPSIAPPGLRVTDYVATVHVGARLLRSVSTHATRCRFGGLAGHHRYELTVSADDVSAGSPNATLHVVAP